MSTEEKKEKVSRDLVTELNGILQKADKYLEFDVVNRHSFFQLNHFIVNKEPTTQSKMWQCLRELSNRRDTIEDIQLEIEETRDNIELLKIEVRREKRKEFTESTFGVSLSGDDASLYEQERDIKVRQIERRKNSLDRSLNKLEKRLQEVAEESKYFLKALDTLQKIEPLKPFDDPQCQREYWNQRLAEELNLRLALKQPIDLELAKAIIAIHDEAPIKKQLLNIIEQLQCIELDEKKRLLENQSDDDDKPEE